MTIQSLSGAVTATEISSFVTFMRAQTPPTTNTYDNTFADGTAGMEVEAMGMMYEVTNDPVLLTNMIFYADAILSLRNDLTSSANGGQRVMWDGNIDPVWLTYPASSSDAGYAGCENNDIVGHIAYCAKLILETPSLWNTTVPDGNPHGYGVTYYERATNYIGQLEYSEANYFNKYFVSSSNYQIVAPTSSAWTAFGESVNAWNRQMMFLNGWQRLSECHQLLGDNSSNVTYYNEIVQASVNWFFNASTSGLSAYTTNGYPVYDWEYAPLSGGNEDMSLHADYDMWGLNRAYLDGIYTNLSESMMSPFGNTLQYVIYQGNNTFADYVIGGSANGTRNYIYPAWTLVADFDPANYFITANVNIAQGSQADTAIFDAFILWVKNARYNGAFANNTNAADYTLSTPWKQTIFSGSNFTCAVTLNPLSGFTNTVALSASHLPEGVTASFNPISITHGAGSSTLTLAVANSTAGGIYALTNDMVISGTSSIGVRTVPLTLVVKPHPAIVGVSLTGTNSSISGTNGFAGATFYLLGSTNASLPLSQWTTMATNAFGTNGNFSVTNKISASPADRFFLIRY